MSLNYFVNLPFWKKWDDLSFLLCIQFYKYAIESKNKYRVVYMERLVLEMIYAFVVAGCLHCDQTHENFECAS